MPLNDNRERYNIELSIRLFSDEYDDIEKCIVNSKDADGFRKYDNTSHFVRCAIIKLIREERKRDEVNGK